MSSDHEHLIAQLARIKALSGLSVRALARQTGLPAQTLAELPGILKIMTDNVDTRPPPPTRPQGR